MTTITTLEQATSLPHGTAIEVRDGATPRTWTSEGPNVRTVPDGPASPWSLFASTIAAGHVRIGTSPQVGDILSYREDRYIDVVVEVPDEGPAVAVRWRNGQYSSVRTDVSRENYPPPQWDLRRGSDRTEEDLTLHFNSDHFRIMQRDNDNLRTRVAGLAETEALQSALDSRRRERDAAQSRYSAYREEVTSALQEAAERMEWTEGGDSDIDRMFEACSVDWPTPPEVQFEALVRFTVRGTPSRREPDSSWIRDSISDLALSLDGDWEDDRVLESNVESIDEIEQV